MGKERYYCRPIGDVLIKARQKQNLSQERIAEATKSSLRTVQMVEHYEANPSLEFLYTLVRFLRLDSNTFFYPEEMEDRPVLKNFIATHRHCTDDELLFLESLYAPALNVYRKLNENDDK